MALVTIVLKRAWAALKCDQLPVVWAEFVWDDLVMGRVCNGPSLLWAEMSSYL